MLGDLKNESSSREVDDLKGVENGGEVLLAEEKKEGKGKGGRGSRGINRSKKERQGQLWSIFDRVEDVDV